MDTPWPAEFTPADAPVYTRNELSTERSAEELWPVLIRAGAWPQWYAHAEDVQLSEGEIDLAKGATFSWKTLGVRVTTTVTEFERARLLAWEGIGPGSRGYHRWILEPAEGGCRIITEEVQTGIVPRLLARRLRRNLHTFHQEWLEGLVARTADLGS